MKRTVEVILQVTVEIDETKLTPKWMEEFRQHFFPFETVDEHVEHLAQLEARGVLNGDFIEGYGPRGDMGIKISEADVVEVEILPLLVP